jgi:hypothetical protein
VILREQNCEANFNELQIAEKRVLLFAQSLKSLRIFSIEPRAMEIYFCIEIRLVFRSFWVILRILEISPQFNQYFVNKNLTKTFNHKNVTTNCSHFLSQTASSAFVEAFYRHFVYSRLEPLSESRFSYRIKMKYCRKNIKSHCVLVLRTCDKECARFSSSR